ncbi:hypothetical protein BVX97_02580 [bacterium E08(2017)]|nr:hypothetical protein BVX97_02580 [bacterium E08(2017)]
MGVADRDYMKKSDDDRKKVLDFEKAMREREYGDMASRRQSLFSKTALAIIAGLIVLVFLYFLVR